MRDLLLRMYRLDHWANETLLEALEEHSSPGAAIELGDGATQLWGHIVGTQSVWTQRIVGEREHLSLELFPTWSVAQCRLHMESHGSLLLRYVEKCSESDLKRVVVFRDSEGTEYSMALVDILTHVSLHGAHHRGQLAREMREAGVEPPRTDAIVFFRDDH